MVAFTVTDADGAISGSQLSATLDIGAEAAGQYIIYGGYARRGATAPLTLTSLTIDSEALSPEILVSLATGSAGAVGFIGVIDRADLPTPSNTSVSMVATFSNTLSNAGAIVIGVTDEPVELHDSDSSLIPHTGSGVNDATHDMVVDVAAGGVVLGLAGVRWFDASTGNWATTGLTEAHDFAPTGGGVRFVDAFLSNGSLEADRAIQFSVTDTDNSIFESIGVVGSFRAIAAEGVFTASGSAVTIWPVGGRWTGAGVSANTFVGTIFRDAVVSAAGLGEALFDNADKLGALAASGVSVNAFQLATDDQITLSAAGTSECSWLGGPLTRWTAVESLTATWTAQGEAE